VTDGGGVADRDAAMTRASPVDGLIAAIERHDLDAVRALLDRDATLGRARGSNGQTPVIAAIYRRAGDIVELLRRRGVTLDVFEAAAAGDVERVTELLDADPSLLHAHAVDGWTPLHLAAHFRQDTIVVELLERGADVHLRSRNSHANTALHAALAGGASPGLVRRLLAAGVEVDARQGGGYTALHEAAGIGAEENVRLLLVSGADPTARTDKGETPADLANQSGHATIARLLRDRTERRTS